MTPTHEMDESHADDGTDTVTREEFEAQQRRIEDLERHSAILQGVVGALARQTGDVRGYLPLCGDKARESFESKYAQIAERIYWTQEGEER